MQEDGYSVLAATTEEQSEQEGTEREELENDEEEPKSCGVKEKEGAEDIRV